MVTYYVQLLACVFLSALLSQWLFLLIVTSVIRSLTPCGCVDMYSAGLCAHAVSILDYKGLARIVVLFIV